MTTHCSVLAWRIPWTEEPGGLQSMGLQRVRHDGSDLACAQCIHVSVLPCQFTPPSPSLACVHKSVYVCISIGVPQVVLSFISTIFLLLRRFSHVRFYATPETAAHQAPPSLGFSRQEHWSGLPFPSPMHERKSESEVAQLCPTLSDPVDCSLPSSSIHGIFQARVLEWVANICINLDICFSDLLLYVYSVLGPYTSLEQSQIHSFLWLSIIPPCICIDSTASLPIHLSMRGFHVLAIVNRTLEYTYLFHL